ncbi:MAG TPA: prephenate dehydrogenase/arogenate dehydrogenase family protein [Thermoanaerobaculia bacterium]|nr:prephenate dehydrogenase/arogenate dehydrogenase family protein [Thermoanaerobaculia bacterium]
MEGDGLDSLRRRIRQIDDELVALAAERVRLARRIGEIKRAAGRPTIDYAQERRVLEAAGAAARRHGVESAVAQDLLARLIQAAVTAQEEESLRQAATGRGKRAVVVGGAGRMGRWMRHFLEAQGWSVAVDDPEAPEGESARALALLPDADLVVLSTPPGHTAERYRQWREKPPRGVVVDIASIKTPLLGPIAALQRAGGRVASIHPMFGPSKVLLRGADVVVCDTGDDEATALVEHLFAATSARRVHLPLEEHDRIMADLLSMAHAFVIAFALALPADEHPVHSVTFQVLEEIAAKVARESPQVYYEIQVDNPHSAEALDRLLAALGRLREVLAARDREGFVELMAEGRRRTPDRGRLR